MSNGDFGVFGALGTLFALGAVVIIIFLLAGIALYILGTFGLYSMGKRRGIELSWLAFIPVAQLYVVGAILKKLKIWGLEIPRPELTLPVAWLVVIILNKIAVIGFLASIANLILVIGAFYYLYKMYKGKDTAILYTILSFILWFMLPIFLFTLRNTDPIEENNIGTTQI
jgi:hypothetical protein